MRYASLDAELRIGEVYLRVLLDGAPKRLSLHQPGQFFNLMYHRLLWEPSVATRLLCLDGMARTYCRYAVQIGAFPDVGRILTMLRSCTHRAERDRYVGLLGALARCAANARAHHAPSPTRSRRAPSFGPRSTRRPTPQYSACASALVASNRPPRNTSRDPLAATARITPAARASAASAYSFDV